ncbi:ANTAR domain-containing protein [Embleya sp. NPDC008237]|uniref:ANTAR domain-containing protein n=1 Tax=Embleya sp. NPDC008237 TaxID=3363978 RepID=UPI0036EDB9C8
MTTVPQRAMARYLLAQQARAGPGLGPLPLPECAESLGLDGLAFLLAPGGPPPELLQSCGDLTAPLEDLQLTQGQGPSTDAARGTLFLAADLSSIPPTRWPGLLPAITDLGVHAIFAFPLRVGVIVLGVLTGHRTTPSPMTPGQLTDAFVLAGSLSSLLIGTAAHPDTPTALLAEGQGLHFAEVHQATGMVSAQLGVSPAQALVRLRAHAFGHDTPLLETARAVLGRRLRFHTEDDDDTRTGRP